MKRLARYRRATVVAGAALVALSACSGGSGNTVNKGFDTGCAKGIPAVSSSASKAATKAKQKGLQFITSHAALVKCAKALGGTLVVQSTDTDPSPYVRAFEERYPQLKVKAISFDGTESRQRFLIEAKSGRSGQYDVGYAAPENYQKMASYMKTFDIYGMAQQKILDIPIKMVDPDNRTIVSTASTIVAYAYNPKLMKKSELPTKWSEFTEPRFASNKLGMATDITFKNEAVSVPFDGEGAMLAYAKGVARNKPVWVTSYDTGLQNLIDGEVAVFPYVNLHSANRILAKDKNASLKVGFIEPVPVRTSDTYGVLNAQFAKNPYAALLYIEWLCSPQAQALKDGDATPQGSIYADPAARKALRGHKTEVMGFNDIPKAEQWASDLVKAAGFPQAKPGS